jgi:hypothetical protein
LCLNSNTRVGKFTTKFAVNKFNKNGKKSLLNLNKAQSKKLKRGESRKGDKAMAKAKEKRNSPAVAC